MVRERQNFIRGTLSALLPIGGTTLSSTGLADMQAIAAPDTAVIVLDPLAVFGDPEIVCVTTHAALGVTATITRGQQGTVARQHAAGTVWKHAPIETDFGSVTVEVDGNDPMRVFKEFTEAQLPAGAPTGATASATDGIRGERIKKASGWFNFIPGRISFEKSYAPVMESAGDAAANFTKWQAAISDAKADGRHRIDVTGDFYINDVGVISSVNGLEVVGQGQPIIRQTTNRLLRVEGNSQDVHISGLVGIGPWSYLTNAVAGNGAAIVFGSDVAANQNAVVQDCSLTDCRMVGFKHAAVLMYAAQFGLANPQAVRNVRVENLTAEDCQAIIFLYKNVHDIRLLSCYGEDIWGAAYALDTRAASDTDATVGMSNIKAVDCSGRRLARGGFADQISSIEGGWTIKGQIDGLSILGSQFEDIGVGNPGTNHSAAGIYSTADADVTSIGSHLTISGGGARNIDKTGTGTAYGVVLNETEVVNISNFPVEDTDNYGYYLSRVAAATVVGGSVKDTGPGAADYAVVINGSASKQVRTAIMAGVTLDRGTGGATHAVFVGFSDDVTVLSNPFTGYPTFLTEGSSNNRLRNFLSAAKQGSTTDLKTVLVNMGLLTSGGATPLNLNGGALTAGSPVTSGDGTGSPDFIINGAAGGQRSVRHRSAGVDRWIVAANTATESGSNAGSDYAIQSRTDAGGLLRNDLIIARASGLWTIAGAVKVGGDAELDGALNHDGTTVGFYGTTPIAKQTGVGVDAASIHAALVALGLISA